MSSVSFDPYHKWLGIPKGEQPAHHYRLLGIPAFEEDPQVIEGAADRQMAFLRKFQSGEHAADATKLLNEISRVRLCLLKPDTKSAYDETLKSDLESSAGAIDQNARPLWQQPAVVGGAVVATVIVVALTLMLAPRGKPATTVASNANVAKVEPGTSKPVETNAGKASEKTETKSKTTSAKPAVETKTTEADAKTSKGFVGTKKDKAPWPTLLDDEPESATKTEKTAASQNATNPTEGGGKGGMIDLLSRIDFARDSAAGEWLSDERGMLGRVPDNSSVGRLNVPYRPPQEYDLHLSVERELPTGSFVVGLPVQGEQCVLVLDTGARNLVSGLSQVDGKLAHQNETTRRGKKMLPGGEQIPVICSVRRNAVTIQVDGSTIIDWKGPADRLSAPAIIPFVDPQSIMLAVHGGSFRVTELKLKLLDGAGSSTSEAPPSTTAAVETGTGPAEGNLRVEKQPAPDEAAQEAARKVVRELFKVEYGLAKKAEGRNLEPRISLARSLFSKAQDTDDDPAACYVMMSEAAEFAAEAGQLGLAWEVLQALGERFNMTPLPLMERAAKAAKPFAKSAEEITALARMYALLIDEAIQVDDFDTAGKAAQEANIVARKIPVLKEQLATCGRRSNQLREAFELAKPARDSLQSNPDDGSANLTWGRYVCFLKRDWTTGLPFLAKSSDVALAALARADLGQPADAEALSKLGDDWWTIAGKEKEPLKSSIRERSIDAWQLAILRSSDRSQQQALNVKISRIYEPTKHFETSGSGQGVAVSGPDLNPGPFFTVEFWVATTSSQGVLISKRHQRRESSIVIRLERGCPVIGGDSTAGFENAESRVSIDDGRWHHVAAVKIGNQLGLFVDGKSVAQTVASDVYLSASPWKVGHQDAWSIDEVEAKFCRLRFSKEARYLVNFVPERTYPKDKGTLFVP